MSDVEKVAEYLDEHGWHQGALYSTDGSACLIGATLRVFGLEEGAPAVRGERYGDALDAIETAVQRLFPTRAPFGGMMHPIARFNDHADTTREDVNLVLKHAAAGDDG